VPLVNIGTVVNSWLKRVRMLLMAAQVDVCDGLPAHVTDNEVRIAAVVNARGPVMSHEVYFLCIVALLP
jgi:hypothetical protein